MLNAKQVGIQVPFFWVFVMTQPGIEPQFPGPLVNTLMIRPMDRLPEQVGLDSFPIFLEENLPIDFGIVYCLFYFNCFEGAL